MKKFEISSRLVLASVTALSILLGTTACSRETPAPEVAEPPLARKVQQEPEILELTDAQAEQLAGRIRGRANLDLAQGLEVDLWAPERLLGDPVAINVDYQGRVWTAVTHRSNNSEFDIRGYRDWIDPSMTWETVEDRRAFLREELAPEKSDQNTWLPDRNGDGSHDWRDLAVVEEEVWLLEDTSGNGLADRSSLFLRAFNEEITDVLGGIYYHNQRDQLFLAVAPDAWRVEDTSGDGRADVKESLSHGYGVHIGFSGHGMSGMTLGPDGRIYYSIGDIGANITDSTGRHWYYPNQGVIARSEPDGSNFEIFAAGLRNTHEFAFDKYGNLISVDNDGDHEGEHERVVYLVDGSDSGWRINWQFGKYTDPKNNSYKVLMDEGYYRTRFEGQAAHLLPPIAPYHSGPAGMAYNPGTALGEQWRDHFFVAEYVGVDSRSGINAFTLEPSGASFELASDQSVLKGIQVTGMDFGPDGALYMADFVEGWQRSQTGRIWKMDVAQVDRALRDQTRELLAEDFADRGIDALVSLLGHADMRVRSKAQFELVDRGEAEPLLAVADSDADQLSRIHGLWGIGQLSRQQLQYAEHLLPFLDDRDAEIRAQAASLLGDVRFAPALEPLLPLLQDDSERVRFFATQALGRIGDPRAVQPIIAMLADNDDRDVYLRHGGAIALERIGDSDDLAALAEHPSVAVRIAAVVALQRLRHPAIALFLDDSDEFVVTSAARGIVDDLFIEDAIPALAALLDQDQFNNNEPLLRRVINAAVYSGTAEDAARLGAFTLGDADPVLRAEAINTLAVWPASSVYDRVAGRYRGEVNNNLEDARAALQDSYPSLLADASEPVRTATVRALGALGFSEAAALLRQFQVEDPADAVRIVALEALEQLDYAAMGEAVFEALNDRSQAVRTTALAMVPELDLPAEQVVEMHLLVLDTGSATEQQAALASLASIQAAPAYEFFAAQLEQLLAGQVAPDIQLDLLLAAEHAQSDQVQSLLTRYQDSKDPDDKMDQFRESLYGGDAEQGHNLFRFNPAAQCVRCHVLDGRGSPVGPELTHVADRLSRYQLLQALVDPQARVAPGFGTITLTLKDGETLQGFFEAEDSGSVTLQVDGTSRVVLREAIADIDYSPSGMPSMAGVLSRSELRDLTEFLTRLKSH